jgi:hypothetical protein
VRLHGGNRGQVTLTLCGELKLVTLAPPKAPTWLLKNRDSGSLMDWEKAASSANWLSWSGSAGQTTAFESAYSGSEMT